MPRVGVTTMRRKQLIDATVSAIHAYGYDATTMAKIAARAGISAGLIAHYFGSKGELLEETMRALLSELQRLAATRLVAAGRSPRARIAAIVEANFDDSQCTPQIVAAWLAFWGQVPHEPGLRRLQRIYSRRLHSNLKRELGRLGLRPEEAARQAEIAAALIDGVWVRAGLSGGGLDTAGARRLVLETIDLHLAAHGVPAREEASHTARRGRNTA